METIAYQTAGKWTEVSLTSLGVGLQVRVELATHAASKVTLPLASLPPEIAPAIPFEAPCIIYTGRTQIGFGGTILFQGRRTDNSGQATASIANQELVIEDAWYDLRFITLQAAWQNVTGYTNGNPTYGPVNVWPDCVLMQASPAGMLLPSGAYTAYVPAAVNSHITTGQAIREMLAYAIHFAGVNLQIGQIDPAAYVPFYPVRSRRIADCIKVALRVHPDCCCEIDYTTTPPTFNVRARANLAALTLPYKGSANGRTHLTSTVRPRPDLQATRVGIYIKTNTTVNGQDVVNVGTDIYPLNAASGLRSLDVSLDMSGPKLAKTSATLITAAFDPTNLAWWAQKVPSLAPQPNGQIPASGAGALTLLDATVNGGLIGHLKGIQVTDDSGNAISLLTYPYELVSGTPASWMQSTLGGNVAWIEANVTAFFTYNKVTSAGGSAVVDQVGEHMHTCRVKLINTASGTFNLSQTLSTGEVYPSGLAQNIYNSLAALQYNFVHSVLESPFITLVKPGKHSLNLQGGSPAWVAMAAMIQSVDIDLMFSPASGITTAKTTIHCGPVDHLEAGELVELFNLFCNRDLSKINPSERSGGTSMSGGQVTLGAETPKENSVPSIPVPSENNNIVVSNGAVIGQTVQSAPMVAAITNGKTPYNSSQAAMQTMQPREFAFCDSTGNVFYVAVQATAGHTTA
jgi:hypothetical protein